MQYIKQLSSSRAVIWLACKAAAIFIFLILMCPNSVLAANWVYLQRQEGTLHGACTEYIDAASVEKTDDKITYWTLRVFDEKSEHHNIMKILQKKETALSGATVQYRTLEQYFFDAENIEIRHYLNPVVGYGKWTDEVTRALGYAKIVSSPDATRPDYIDTPSPRWYGVRTYDNCELYWDSHSIVAWPQDKPTTIDIRVKQVWNQKGIESRKAFIATQKPYNQNKDNDVNYTVLSCQLLIDQSVIRILEVTDYDSEDNRATLLDGTDWKIIQPGSMEDDIRSIALNWIKDSEVTD